MPEDLVPFLEHLEDLKVKYGGYLAAGGHIDAPCLCGRPLRYRHCHGTDIANLQKGLERTRQIYTQTE